MKITNIAYGALLIGVLSIGCVREDLSDCVYDDEGTVSRHTLLLSYKGDGTTEIFNDKICCVELYVFDGNNQCVYSGELSSEEVASRSVDLPLLSPDTYQVVCLGNTHYTDVQGLETCAFENIVFGSKAYFNGEEVSGNDSLYHASLTLPVTKSGESHTIEFSSSHYDLSVEVAGTPVTEGKATGPLKIEVCGVCPCTDFQNRACGDAVDYVLPVEYQADGTLLAETNIMRHDDHESVDVCVRSSTDELLAQVNLADFLSSNPVIDCTKQEVLIPIHIAFTSLGVEVSVPQWYLEEVKPEF